MLANWFRNHLANPRRGVLANWFRNHLANWFRNHLANTPRSVLASWFWNHLANTPARPRFQAPARGDHNRTPFDFVQKCVDRFLGGARGAASLPLLFQDL